ncbi:dapper homolog 1 [Betta splendens]|uniref:Dapper homolog 1 n=1 Tax=Betta splendens TaxID=158456 RepID=A0A6P7LK30_BETSP|nr:dapper homolog 1 [Betta splendens]
MSRDRVADPDAAERLHSVRERLEATMSGLEELEFLRQRQEVLVRTALDRRKEVELRSEEKLLEENILLLRQQLNCLRRRDTSLISQLQELDRQIYDLRLDTEMSPEQLETDSRPSSGFYELSDGAFGSLSNSSNSVFSECFCSAPDADGRLQSTDELSCLECDSLLGGLCDDSATVRRSSSAPHPPTLDYISSLASCDSQSKFHYDLVARSGSDVYRYPSPLHAVAVQSPAFLQMLGHGSHSRDEALVRNIEALAEAEAPPLLASLVSQSFSWPASSSSSSLAPTHKHLDSYIFSLLQRRALPVRTSRPRTSISTDPSKSILRQASLCVKPVPAPSSGCGSAPLAGSDLKPWWMFGAASAEEAASSLEQQMLSVPPHGSVDVQTGFKMKDSDLTKKQNSSPLCNGTQNDGSAATNDTNSLLKKNKRGPLLYLAVSAATLPEDSSQVDSPRAKFTPRDMEKLIDCPTVRNSPEFPHISRAESSERPVVEPASLGFASQSPDEGGSTRIQGRSQSSKVRKTGSKTVGVRKSRVPELSEPTLTRKGDKFQPRSSSRKSRLLENKVSKRITGGAPGASAIKIKRLPASIPEGRVLDKQTTSTLSATRSGASRNHHINYHHSHHHHHGRDQVVVVAKPKHKRNDYRRLRAIMEVPYDEAFRRVHRHQTRDLHMDCPSGGQMSSPYSYMAASDSEYSAECASLFHSTIVDTSEDEKSNYTTNCFGDSESSTEEYVEESTTTSDTEESGGGGTGGRSRAWNQPGPTEVGTVGQEMTPAQAKAFVKIKASHNLKKKILRFRSGSLKLMTTV